MAEFRDKLNIFLFLFYQMHIMLLESDAFEKLFLKTAKVNQQ